MKTKWCYITLTPVHLYFPNVYKTGRWVALGKCDANNRLQLVDAKAKTAFGYQYSNITTNISLSSFWLEFLFNSGKLIFLADNRISLFTINGLVWLFERSTSELIWSSLPKKKYFPWLVKPLYLKKTYFVSLYYTASQILPPIHKTFDIFSRIWPK